MAPNHPRARSQPRQSIFGTGGGGGGGEKSAGQRLRENLPSAAHHGNALAAALSSAGATALARCVQSRRPSLFRLVRGAAAGAGAAGVVYVARQLTDRPEGHDFTDEVLAGAGRGIVYAAVLEPFLPGPPAVRGAILGVVEYITAPWGGALSRLQDLSPARKLPIVGALLEAGEAEEDPFLAFALFGVALGLLYGRHGPPARAE